MTFFYDLNKRLAAVNDKPETQQLNERDMSRAAKGYEKYGKQGMQALAKAGRDGKALDPVRNKYDKYDNKEVDEGLGDMVKKVGGMAKKVGGAVLNKLGHGDDADMIRDLQKRRGLPPTGKKPEPEQKTTEAARYRDPKYKDQLYTQEPLDHTFGPDMDAAHDNNYPDDYAGRKSPMDSGNGDPLKKGYRMSADNSINTRGPRKGLPSRDQINSLKNSIKDAHGTHAQPNLPEETDEGYRNQPHTQTQSVKSQMNQGNDLNAKKAMHKHSYRQGDNPMAMEEQQSVARLEKELMEELSSLKVVSKKYAGKKLG